MFGGIGWTAILVLGVAGLLILGPERLPSAAAGLRRTKRKVRKYTADTHETLASGPCPEFNELSEPTRNLKGLHDRPRKVDEPGRFDAKRPDRATSRM